MPLRVGVGGDGKVARGIEFQVKHADGMELAWRHHPDDVESHLKSAPIDVFVEACCNVHDAAECSLLAIENHAHIVLTDARVDVAYGLPIQTEAHQNGIAVTSDIGTPHGALATMIQEAHIMGFETLQAGQISPGSEPTQFLYEMAALANGFSFAPPEGGMKGPEVDSYDEIVTAFDLENIGETPQIDFVRIASAEAGLYLIVRPRQELPKAHLDGLLPGKGPFYLIRRSAPLGYLETPKTILAAAAGQPVLSPGYPTCNVYAVALRDLKVNERLTDDSIGGELATLETERLPLISALDPAVVHSATSKGEPVTYAKISVEQGE